MHTSTIAMPELFAQLGMAHSKLAIVRFIKHHHIPEGVRLQAANFWTQSQRQFLKDSLQQDSDWCEIVDRLDVLLRQ